MARTKSKPRLYLTDTGAGEPVLLITGWTISSAVFDPVAPLYKDVRVVAYDHRGTGRSDAWVAPVSLAMLAADAARLLDDRGIDCAHIVGLSMGALVALELAVRMPSRVKTLVLVGGGAGGPANALPGAAQAASTLKSLTGDSLRHGDLWPSAVLFSEQFRKDHPVRVNELVRPFRKYRAPVWSIFWQTLAVACFGRSEALAKLRVPTLIVHGSEDVMSPPANAKALAKQIPGAELALFEGVGHAVPLERAEDCATLLLAWIERHRDHVPEQQTNALHERLTRPLSLQLGTLRNTASAAALLVNRGRSKGG